MTSQVGHAQFIINHQLASTIVCTHRATLEWVSMCEYDRACLVDCTAAATLSLDLLQVDLTIYTSSHPKPFPLAFYSV